MNTINPSDSEGYMKLTKEVLSTLSVEQLEQVVRFHRAHLDWAVAELTARKAKQCVESQGT